MIKSQSGGALVLMYDQGCCVEAIGEDADTMYECCRDALTYNHVEYFTYSVREYSYNLFSFGHHNMKFVQEALAARGVRYVIADFVQYQSEHGWEDIGELMCNMQPKPKQRYVQLEFEF